MNYIVCFIQYVFAFDETAKPGDYRGDETPDPIPNSEVKSSIADGTPS